MKRAALVAGVLTAALAAAAPSAGAASPKCAARGSKTIASTSKGRLYTTHGTKRLFGRNEGVTRFFGCLYSTGRSWSLGFNADNGADLGLPFVSAHRLAGPYGAFLEVRGSDGGPDGGAVVRRDLRTGEVVRDDTPASVPSDPPTSPFVANVDEYQPDDLVLRPDGAMAWTVTTNGDDSCRTPCRVLASDRNGRSVLDEGTKIRANSLALSGTTVSWTRDGVRKTATLR